MFVFEVHCPHWKSYCPLNKISFDSCFLIFFPKIFSVVDFAKWCIRMFVYDWDTHLINEAMWLFVAVVSNMCSVKSSNTLDPIQAVNTDVEMADGKPKPWGSCPDVLFISRIKHFSVSRQTCSKDSDGITRPPFVFQVTNDGCAVSCFWVNAEIQVGQPIFFWTIFATKPPI